MSHPDFPATVDYHVAHAPFGAFASFTCGLCTATNGTTGAGPGGFSIGSRRPAAQNLFIGYRRGAGPWRLLPFIQPKADRAAEFTTDQVSLEQELAVAHEIIPPGEVRRTLGMASDRFEAGPLAFSLYSPFERIPELNALDAERQKLLVAPLVSALLEGDNTGSDEPLEVMFGFEEPDSGQRILEDTHPGLAGFAVGTRYGFAAAPGPGTRLNSGFSLFTTWRRDGRNTHLLGASAAVIGVIPPRTAGRLPLTLGFFQDGAVTTGLDSRYLYTRHFGRLEDVLTYGLEHHGEYLQLAAARDEDLRAKALTAEQAWLIAHSVHSYLSSSQLLLHRGKPLWVLNEGEYRMLNTFDLLVDHVFFELVWWPWAVRDTLDLFAKRYSYTDTIHAPDGRTAKGGLSFAHDMGVDNQFTPPGLSSYELPNLTDCFSYMTSEQLTNWVCTAVCYVAHTHDETWLRQHRGTLKRCARSLRVRDDPKPRRRNGIIKWDSDRCGPKGSEITTYDSLDVSLGQARNNVYLAVKTLGAWLLLEHAFRLLGDEPAAAAAAATAALLAKSVSTHFEETTGMFPAVFENHNTSRIIPAIEGLVYPLFVGLRAKLDDVPELKRLVGLLDGHLQRVLVPGVCLDAKSGGWKLSSSSTNTWMSKIFLCQHVARKLFPDAISPAAAAADAVHVRWLVSPVTKTLNFCDQLNSETGEPLGSRNYPRGVSAWLWVM
jgi:hypothetical protein